MIRHRNTDTLGKPFTPNVIQAVWEKAESNPTHRPLKIDAFGAVIWREAFGNINSKLGWEIHHRLPVDQGGTDDLDNLEAVQWENHRRLDAAVAKADEPDTLVPSGPATDPADVSSAPVHPDLLQAVPVA